MTTPQRFGSITGDASCALRCGTVNAVFNQNVAKFSTGNLSNQPRTAATNINLIEAASTPSMRSIGQAVIPPSISINASTGEITTVAGRITSGFGQRDPGTPTGSTNHPAVDFNKDSSNPNTSFYSPVAGTVVIANEGYVVIQTADGYYHKFLHGSNIEVAVSQVIQSGTVLGTIANLSANATDDGTPVRAMAAHVDYRIGTTQNDVAANLVSPTEYWSTRELPSHIQQTLPLPKIKSLNCCKLDR
jgi:murein DD-endopeptidase MepM/ murein hydrolase activator NlpD